MKIAFVGRAGSGKSTVAEYLVTRHGFVRLSFATKIKEFACQILQRPIDKFNPSDRSFLQELGTIARRADPDVWLKWMELEIAALESENENIVVDDCRFIREGAFLKKHGFTLIKLGGRAYEMGEKLMKHVSETELDRIACDFTLDAGVPLKEEFKALEKILKKLRRG